MEELCECLLLTDQMEINSAINIAEVRNIISGDCILSYQKKMRKQLSLSYSILFQYFFHEGRKPTLMAYSHQYFVLITLMLGRRYRLYQYNMTNVSTLL